LLYFKLTDEQRAVLTEAEAAVAAASRDGQPGLLLAQLIDGYAVAGFIEHERAALIVAGLGGDVTRYVSRIEERGGRMVACGKEDETESAQTLAGALQLATPAALATETGQGRPSAKVDRRRGKRAG
jgi:hypothetical protein